MIVVDASVAVTALADDGSAGHELRTRLQADADLHVPELLDLEVAAVLRRLVVVERTLSTRRASEALEDLADLPAERYGHRPLLGRVWELRQSNPTFTVLRGHTDAVSSVAFSSDGHTLVSGGKDHTVRLWDLRQPESAPTVLSDYKAPV